MNKNVLRERKAISGAIMALILIGIAVVAGIVVFTSFNTTTGTAAIKNTATIDTLSVINPEEEDSSTATESIMATATLKNTGNKAIKSAQMILMVKNGGGGEHVMGPLDNFGGTPLQPGESARIEIHAAEGNTANNIDESVDLNLGRSIPIHIIITFIDDSQADITTKGIIQ